MASSITVTGQSRITAYGSIAVTGQARITDQPQSGYNIIRMTTAPATGKSLQVRYYRLGQDLIVCEDTPLVAQRAAIEEGNGKYHQLAQDSGNTNFSAGLQTTQKALATYKTLPQTAMLKTFRPGLLAGMYLTVKIRTGGYWNLPDFLNSTWLIQQVDGQYIPFLYGVSESLLTWDDATMTWDEATFTWDATDSYEFGPLLYTITLISVARIPNWVDDWEKLAQRG